jgi:hypothetical protein
MELLDPRPLTLLGPSASDRRQGLATAASLEPHRGMAEMTNRVRAVADAAVADAVAAAADAAKKAEKKAATDRCQDGLMTNRLPTAGPPMPRISTA